LKLTRQFDIWLLSHLQPLLINGFDNTLGIDLMIFAMKRVNADITAPWHRLNILGLLEAGTAALTTAAISYYPRFFKLYDNPNTSHFLLLHYFFHDIKRSGKYFMSGARYANAALHCVKFLFDTRYVLIIIIKCNLIPNQHII